MISIIMPVYNEEKYIKQAVASVLEQSYRDLELIVVDDGSNDSTKSILMQLENTDDRLKIIYADKIGKNAAFNRGFASASGEWVGLFAGDDIMETDALKNLMSVAKGYNPHEQKVLVAALTRFFSDDKEYKSENDFVPPMKNIDGIFTNPIGIASIALASQAFPLPESYPNEDTWTALIYRYLSDVRIQTQFIYSNYRVHANNSFDHSGRDFSAHNEAYHKRRIVVKEFYERYSDFLTKEQKETLVKIYQMETLRYQGKTIRVLFVKGLPLGEKIKAMVHSNAFLNRMRFKLHKYISGRI